MITHKNFNKRTSSNISVNISGKMADELIVYARNNGRSFEEEVFARLVDTLEETRRQIFHQKLMQLIFCSELAYENCWLPNVTIKKINK